MIQTFFKDFEANSNEALARKMNDWITAFDVDCSERGIKYSYTANINNPYVLNDQVFFTAMLNVEVDDDYDEEEEL